MFPAFLGATCGRDISAQETARYNMGVALAHCSQPTVSVSTSGGAQLNIDGDDGDPATTDNTYKLYARRLDICPPEEIPRFRNQSLQNFATHWKKNNKGELIPRDAEGTVAVFSPFIPCEPNGKRYPEYCKHKLIRHKLWDGTPHSTWATPTNNNGQNPTDKDFVNAWKTMVDPEGALPRWALLADFLAHEQCTTAEEKKRKYADEQEVHITTHTHTHTHTN